MRVGEIFSLAVAALIGLYTATLQPWSTSWWAGCIIAATIALVTGWRMLADKWPRFFSVSRSRIAMVAVAIISATAMLGSDYWYYSRYLVPAVTASPAVLSAPPKSTPLTLVSKLTRIIFACEVSSPKKTAAEIQKAKDDLKKRAKILGDALGIRYTFADIDGGIRMESEAISDETKQSLGFLAAAGITKASFEFRRVGEQVMVTIQVGLPAGPTSEEIKFLSSVFSLEPDDPDVISVQHTIEKMVGADDDACHLI